MINDYFKDKNDQWQRFVVIFPDDGNRVKKADLVILKDKSLVDIEATQVSVGVIHNRKYLSETEEIIYIQKTNK